MFLRHPAPLVLLVSLLVALITSGCGGDDEGSGDGGGRADGGSGDAGAADGAVPADGGDGSDAGTGDGGARSDGAVETDGGGGPCVPVARTEIMGLPSRTLTSFAVASDGTVGATFAGPTETLLYGSNATGAWVTETVDTSDYPYIGTPTATAFDPTGAAHVLFEDIAGGLSYLTNRSGAWEHFPSTTGVLVDDLDVEVDATGTVRGTFRLDRSVHYLESDGAGGWTNTTVVPDTAGRLCRRAALDVDTTGEPRLAYLCRTTATGPYDVHFARPDAGGGFDEGLVASEAAINGRIEIVTRPDGLARIAFSRIADNLLGVADEGPAGTFSADTPLADTTQLVDMAADADGAIHLLHGYHAVGLSYGTDASGSFETSVIEDTWLDGRAAIAVGADGRVHVAEEGIHAVGRALTYRAFCP